MPTLKAPGITLRALEREDFHARRAWIDDSEIAALPDRFLTICEERAPRPAFTDLAGAYFAAAGADGEKKH